jgi:undecaprenyl diphosphate synthase
MEIIEAFNRSGTPELFYKHLAVSNPVDLIIRTGGANVMSGFLPLQSGFARLYFTDTLFNDFLAANLAEILGLFRNTIRKFGE